MSIPARYSEAFAHPRGPGDARPTGLQIIHDEGIVDGLRGKTILITGGNEGSGLETARALHMTGARIFITTRSTEKAQAAITDIINSNGGERGGIEALTMHLDDLESVKTAAESFLKKSDRLDILICSAGILSPTINRTKQGSEICFGVNHLGHFLLFRLLQPLLLKSSSPSANSRVVIVASVGHRRIPQSIRFHDLNFEISDSQSEDTMWRYSHSKLANVYMANQIERLYASQGLHAWSLQPAGMKSTVLDAIGPGIEAAYNDPNLANDWSNAEQGAATSVWAAVSRDLEGKGGRYLERVQVSQPFTGSQDQVIDWTVPGYAKHAYNEEHEKKLWDVSEELVKDYLN